MAASGMRHAARGILLSAILACTLDKAVVPQGRERLVVHAVLTTAVSEEVILMERSLTGRVSIDTALTFDPDDPIVSSGGTPVSGAEVTIASDFCQPARAVEAITLRSDGKGAGVYVYPNTPLQTPPPPPFTCVRAQIARGLRYYLSVTDPTGIRVTGATTVPDALTSGTLIRTDTIDAERDTLRFAIDTATLHYRYFVQIETPFGPYSFFTATPQASIAGVVRNRLVRGQPPVFVPGFRQAIQVSAVDTNFFDYSRSRYDPLSTAGGVSHLSGGTGLFGSVLRLNARYVEVTAAQNEPIEGAYLLSPGFFGAATERVRLYIYPAEPDASGLSGRLESGFQIYGILGTVQGGNAQLFVVSAAAAADTLLSFDGSVDGNSITGTVRGRPGTYELRKAINHE